VVFVHDRDGNPTVSTCVIEWGERDPSKRTETGKPKKTPESLATFKKALAFTIADSGRLACPFGAQGCEVMAADRDKVREEFMKSYPAATTTPKVKPSGGARRTQSSI
jgi:hypothetical protein